MESTVTVLLDLTEEGVLRRALELTNGSPSRAAELLGVSRQTVWRRMKRYGIPTPRDTQRAPAA